MSKISRRKLADYISTEIINNNDIKSCLIQVAAYLVRFNRVNEIELLVRDVYDSLQNKGIVYAQVATKNEIPSNLELEIEKFVKKETNCNNVHLEKKLDSSILSGMILTLPDAVFDTTSNRKLHLFKLNNIR